MSQRSFQAALARMVIDPEFRELVMANGVNALGDDLTTIEQERLISIVSSKGLDATRRLHKSFRLTKIYTLLPLTRTLLGPDRLAKEISVFWKAEPPVSHYFLEEAIAFCDFLHRRIGSGLRIKYLDEVVTYEQACLKLHRPQTTSENPQPQFVKFEHDPEILFTQLMSGKRPRAVAQLSCLLAGTLGTDGKVQWSISTFE